VRLVYPDILWLLGLIPILALLLLWSERRRKKRIDAFTSGGRGSFLTQHLHSWSELRRGILALLAGALLIAAAARPQVPAGKVPVIREGRDVAVLLDVSASMLAEDISPNRLQQARRILKGCLNGMGGDRVALVAFAGEAYVQCPLTLDRSALRIFLGALGPDVVGQRGTGIAGALRKGLGVVGRREDRTKVLLLMTDGEDHLGEVEAVQDEIREAGIRIVAVGLGSPAGEPIPIVDPNGGTSYKRDEEGKVVMSRLGEDLLRDLAKGTDGYYVRATGSGVEVDAILDYLDSLEEGEIQGGLRILYEDRYADFVAPAFLLLAFRGLLGQRRRPKKRKGTMKALGAAVLLLSLSGVGPAWAGDSGTDPLSLYEEGRLEEARDRLEELQRDDPKNPRLAFDLGNIAYRAQDYEDAVMSFGEAVTLAEGKGDLQAQALYNQGCALYRAGRPEEALEAFRFSLLLNSDDEDAKVNLEFLLDRQGNQEQTPQDLPREPQDQQDQEQQGQQDEQPQEQQQDQEPSPSDESDREQQDQEQQTPEEEQQQEQTGRQPQPDPGTEEEQQQQQQPSQMPQVAGMSPEDVARLIEALDLQERTLQAERLKSRLRAIDVGKDW
jgi:Ca-activated chloride channel family protein